MSLVTPLQEETNQDQPENAKGTEKDDDSDCTDGFEECCSVEESQPCDATNDDGVQCCSGELLLGIYTINKAYGADHSTLSVNGQARSQKILLGGSFEEYVDLLLLQPSQVS